MNDPQLVAALQNCSFHAFLLILQQVLSPMGYGDVQILDRRRSSQKSRHGGHELVCRTIAAGRLVTVVVKVLHDDVRIGQLDELAGVILRMDSDAGLVVTPHRVSKTAKAMLASNRYKPLQMNTIDGAMLASWLRQLRIGTRGASEVDYAFFGELEAASERVLTIIEEISS